MKVLPTDRATAAEPVVSALRDGIPSAVIDADILLTALDIAERETESRMGNSASGAIMVAVFGIIKTAVKKSTVRLNQEQPK